MASTVFGDFVARFIRIRHVSRHFRRFGVLGAFRAPQVSKGVPPALRHALTTAAQAEIPALLTQFNSHEDGLTDAQATEIRHKVGFNEINHEKPLPWWVHLWYCYKNPFNLLLTVLAIISYYTQDMKAAVVISSMIVLSTSIRFVQESKSNKAADELKDMVSNTATVLRPDHHDTNSLQKIEISIKKLVPGDVVLLSAGDMIPADLRAISAKDLFINQATMTGESLPVEKFPTAVPAGKHSILELESLLFMGTNVVSGSAKALVIATGDRTYFGALAQRVTATDRSPTAFQSGVNKVSWLLIQFMIVMTPIVFLLNGLTKGNWLEAFLFALSIAVGLTPEMLPMIVTSTLAKGAVMMSRKKVIVKRLDAIQNFGAMDVLCTDKTGTLTQDKIFLERYTDAFGEVSSPVLELAFLNSYYQTGLKNLLDVAVLDHIELHHELDIATHFRKVDEIPFDFNRRRMSVVVEEHQDHHLLICKGAVEEMLSVCTQVQHGDQVEAITPELLTELQQVTAALNADGLRVVAVASKSLPMTQATYGIRDESGLTLVGYIAFLDPPKESTGPALKALQDHGITLKILTGDNELVTTKICREVGLEIQGVLLGSEIDALSDLQLTQRVTAANIFAKLTPDHKERIVEILKANGHVVGFMGDGINDAPALRVADIGISVDTAVDIAKEAADIILLEKSLMVLEEGVIEGRKTFSNMLKYIKMTASSNFGNVFSVLVAGIFLPFLPMLPMHLLVQNLLYDISQVAIPFDNVDPELLQLPQKWNPDDLKRFMFFFGPISSIFDILTFAVLWFVFKANTPAFQTFFQSGWFIEGLLSQTLIVHLIRTQKIPFIQSRASFPVLGMTAVVIGAGIFLPLGPLSHYFKLTALPSGYFLFLGCILVGYIALAQVVKSYYIRKFGWQ